LTFQLEEVVPWGRSYDEYEAMFDLSEDDLHGRILGCGDGPASFNAEATTRGIEVVSCDPLYRFGGNAIRQRVLETRGTIVEQVRRNQGDFVWDRFAGPEALGDHRVAAMERFLADYPAGLAGRRYIDASLPHLPFPDHSFDLALCSHFLFLYSRQHDLAFHLAALRELLRVASEVRVFPLLELGGAPSRHVPAVISRLEEEGVSVERVRVDYEFQRGGNEMLRLSSRAAHPSSPGKPEPGGALPSSPRKRGPSGALPSSPRKRGPSS
jgi:hypothetical protein